MAGNTQHTLKSRTVIRVGMPGAPYIVGVIGGPEGLSTVRIQGDPDNPPALGTVLTRVDDNASVPVFAVAEEVTR